MKTRRQYTDEQFKDAVKNSVSLAGVIRKIGLSCVTGGNYSTAKKLIRKYQLDTSHFTGQRTNRGPGHKGGFTPFPLKKVLIRNSNYARHLLKKRCIGAGILKSWCYVCKLKPVWRGKTLVLVLDHVNGINDDNRIENLRLLCPNCNSQTKTFGGRNKNGHAPVT